MGLDLRHQRLRYSGRRCGHPSAGVGGGVILALTTGLIGSSDGAPGKASQIALLVLAVLAALIGLLDMNGAAAIGLYLTLFGGIAWVVGAAWQLNLSRTSVPAPAPASE